MRFDWNAPDDWRERQRWLPAWLDDADWKTWLWHAAVTVIIGQLIGWALPVVTGPWGMRFMVAVYLVREVLNVRDRKRLQMPLKPLDHVMDVLVPLVACELIARAP